MDISPSTNPGSRDPIIEKPGNYDDMVAKLEARQREEEERLKERARGEGVEGATKELDRLQQRRGHIEHLNPEQRKVQKDPQDEGVLAELKRVEAVSQQMDSTMRANPEVQSALLRGRVTIGRPEQQPAAPPKTQGTDQTMGR